MEALRCGGMSEPSKRVREAADQMWHALLMGNTFEVPVSLSTEDEVAQAVLVLRKEHPNVVAKMLQSRGLVLTLGKPATVQEGAWKHLDAAGYFPKDELPPEIFFGQHAQFIRRADLDPEEQVKRAQEESKEFNAISVGER